MFVRPNRYERGRAHVVVYYWEHKDAVEVDLSKVLTRGQKYRVVASQDLFGAPVYPRIRR